MIFEALITIGFIVSLYSKYVQIKIKQDKNYKAVCDINNKISCSKAFLSKEAYLFRTSNTNLGLIGYPVIFLTKTLSMELLTTVLLGCSVLLSVYLAYISYFKQKNFCLVCTLTYALNIALFIMQILK